MKVSPVPEKFIIVALEKFTVELPNDIALGFVPDETKFPAVIVTPLHENVPPVTVTVPVPNDILNVEQSKVPAVTFNVVKVAVWLAFKVAVIPEPPKLQPRQVAVDAIVTAPVPEFASKIAVSVANGALGAGVAPPDVVRQLETVLSQVPAPPTQK